MPQSPQCRVELQNPYKNPRIVQNTPSLWLLDLYVHSRTNPPTAIEGATASRLLISILDHGPAHRKSAEPWSPPAASSWERRLRRPASLVRKVLQFSDILLCQFLHPASPPPSAVVLPLGGRSRFGPRRTSPISDRALPWT